MGVLIEMFSLVRLMEISSLVGLSMENRKFLSGPRKKLNKLLFCTCTVQIWKK
jgi:hypothetical protein